MSAILTTVEVHLLHYAIFIIEMRVLILDGQVNPAVAAVRSLGRAGHYVVVGSSASWSKAGWSRYASGSFRYPSAEANAKAFVARIAEEAARGNGALVVPLTEKTVMALSAQRSLIEAAGGRIVMPCHAVMLRACDKAHTRNVAASAGVPSPATCLLGDEVSAGRCAERFSYPAALKARTSVELRNGHVASTARPLYARKPDEFMRAYRSLRQSASQVIAQKFIEGRGSVYCALLCGGELRAEFAYDRLRSVHPTGWGATLRVSVPASGLRENSLNILRTLDPMWTGLACVEYRVRSDGTPFFLEVNPRAWNSLALAVYAGVDFPGMLAQIAEHGDVPVHSGYPSGIVCRWWLGDLRRVLYAWQGIPNGYPCKIEGRLEALRHFLKPVRHTFHDNFTLSDPLPALGDWFGAATRVLRRSAANVLRS